MPFKIAFAIFRLQPAGGLEQHCLRLAAELAGRGHSVTILTAQEPASLPHGVGLQLLKRRGLTNHGRMAAFLDQATALVATGYDRTVSFHAGGSFDFLFCGDVCRRAQWSGVGASLSPRRKAYLAMEAQPFAPKARTVALGMAQPQMDAFEAAYGAPKRRLIVLPPTLDRIHARQGAARTRMADGFQTWLWAGLSPRTKGLDRALEALKRVSAAELVVCGCDPEGSQGHRARELSMRLGVASRVRWLGFVGAPAIAELMASADLLVHPARVDTAGSVILEALANGLPVVTTAVCGYAEHVEKAGAGLVLAEPFRGDALVSALGGITAERLDGWSRQALAYASDSYFFSGIERAADIIETGLPL